MAKLVVRDAEGAIQVHPDSYAGGAILQGGPPHCFGDRSLRPR